MFFDNNFASGQFVYAEIKKRKKNLSHTLDFVAQLALECLHGNVFMIPTLLCIKSGFNIVFVCLRVDTCNKEPRLDVYNTLIRIGLRALCRTK